LLHVSSVYENASASVSKSDHVAPDRLNADSHGACWSSACYVFLLAFDYIFYWSSES